MRSSSGGAGGRAAPCEPWQPEAALTAPGLVPADCLMRPLRRAGQATTGPWERCTRLPSVVKLPAVQDSSKGILLGSRDLSACWCLERMARGSFHRPRGDWSKCPGLPPSSSWTLREGAQHTGKSHPGAYFSPFCQASSTLQTSAHLKLSAALCGGFSHGKLKPADTFAFLLRPPG